MDNKKAAEILRAIKAGTAHAFLNGDAITSALDTAIAALEKQEQDRWHSIAKEGKPKESRTYIWTCDDGTHRKLVTVAKYFKRTGECMLTGARSYWKAKAWKPLPEPYEEEENNDNEGIN